jgi:hypothetical protein
MECWKARDAQTCSLCESVSMSLTSDIAVRRAGNEARSWAGDRLRQ